MVSDAERRNVAQKLRHEARNPSVYSTYTMLCFITRAKTGEELLFRLANLIEPPMQCPYYHSDRHHCSAYDDVVDRDALLALADEMEQRQRDAATGATDGVVDAWCLREHADRIRAILKEEDDA